MSERLPAFQGLPKSGSYIRIQVGDQVLEGYFYPADELHPQTIVNHPLFTGKPGNGHIGRYGWGHFFVVPQDREVARYLDQALQPARVTNDYNVVINLMTKLGEEGYAYRPVTIREADGTFRDYAVLSKPLTAKRRGRHHKMKMPEGKYADLEIG